MGGRALSPLLTFRSREIGRPRRPEEEYDEASAHDGEALQQGLRDPVRVPRTEQERAEARRHARRHVPLRRGAGLRDAAGAAPSTSSP